MNEPHGKVVVTLSFSIAFSSSRHFLLSPSSWCFFFFSTILFKNTIFFQVLYSYSVSAIKVPSQPFSFTLWLWPFVRLSIFRVNWSWRSPRMLFSFIHSALWMEWPAFGSGSTESDSKNTLSSNLPPPPHSPLILFLCKKNIHRPFKNKAHGLWRSVNRCQSFSMLHFIHDCQWTWVVSRGGTKRKGRDGGKFPLMFGMPCLSNHFLSYPYQGRHSPSLDWGYHLTLAKDFKSFELGGGFY